MLRKSLNSRIVSLIIIFLPITIGAIYLIKDMGDVQNWLVTVVYGLFPIDLLTTALILTWCISISLALSVALKILIHVAEGVTEFESAVPLFSAVTFSSLAQIYSMNNLFRGLDPAEGWLYLINNHVGYVYFLFAIANVLTLWIKEDIKKEMYL